MKRISLFLIMCIIILGVLSGCSNNTPSPLLKDEGFVKPKNYAAIVNVEINPSFDIYLDEQAIVLAIEPKNEDADKLDVSGVVGNDLATSMRDLMSAVCKNHPVSTETVALVQVLEGEEIAAEVNAVEIIKDAWADTVAKETVNISMESVLRARVEMEYGCKCKDCLNWYSGYWYSYGEWDRKWDHDEYEDFMERFSGVLRFPLKNDPSEPLATEIYNKLTYENCNSKEIRRQLFYLQYDGNPGKYHRLGQLNWNKMIKEVTHEEIEITFKIVDTEVAAGHIVQSKEYSPEEYFEKYPEDREIIKGLEKVHSLELRVYKNGQWREWDYDHYTVYLVDGKWYASDGFSYSPGA